MVNEQQQPPGLYRWDGRTYTPIPPPGAGRGLLVAAGMIGALLLGLAGGVALASTTRPASSPTASASTVATQAPTQAPTAAPTPVRTPIALSGTGSKVLPVTLQAGRYKVDWTAQGNDNFIVHVLGDNQINLVNEIPPNPSSGETLLTVRDTNTYQLQVQASTLTWTITLTRL